MSIRKILFHLVNPYQFVFSFCIFSIVMVSFFLILPVGLFHFIILQSSLSVSQVVSQYVDKIDLCTHCCTNQLRQLNLHRSTFRGKIFG